MKNIKPENGGISTILAFALIPLSGFATDIYIPSLPAMATNLGVGNASVQLSILLFMMSYGISQLLVGSILDSFGRFRIGSLSLLVFSLSSFAIAMTHSIYLIFAMRILQGITVSFIIIGKRAYFMDTFQGEKLKHYTSMFSIVWASAPIIAPFLGGYFQTAWGWQSNFYFLGILSLVILALEQIYSGETLKVRHPFNFKTIAGVYQMMFKAADFTYALIIVALSYSMLVVFGMTSPFLIEKVFGFSPVTSGYSALLSGIALMSGGIISKAMLHKPLAGKLRTAAALQVLAALLMTAVVRIWPNIYTMMVFVIILHMLSGFVFNNLFAYCLGRFTKNAGVSSGVTGGGNYVITSFFSYTITGLLHITVPALLGVAYLVFALLFLITFFLFRKAVVASNQKNEVVQPA
jgi:MFS family permease